MLINANTLYDNSIKKGLLARYQVRSWLVSTFLRTANKKKYKDLETPKERTQTFADIAAMQK